MKLLHLSWDITSHSGGGERAVVSIVRAINAVCPCTLAIVARHAHDSDACRASDIDALQIPALFGPFDNPLPRVGVLRDAVADADVLHVHQAHTMLLDVVQLLKRPHQRLVVSDYGGGGPNVSRFLGRHSRVDAVVAYSASARRRLSHLSPQMVNIPLPIDTDLFRVLPHVRVRDRSVLCVGRLLPHKGFDTVIRALPPNWALTIVGQPYDAEYVRYMQALAAGKDVHFLADIGDDELVRLENQAAIFVAPSVGVDYKGRAYRDPELFGLAAAEAAACGRPVLVSTAVPALQDAIHAGVVCGASYDWSDAKQLAALIVRAATSEVKMKNRRYVVERHSVRTIGELFVGLYERLLASAG